MVTFAEAGPPFVATAPPPPPPPFLRASRIGTAVAEIVRSESASGVQEEKCIVIMNQGARRNRVEEIKI